MTQLVTLSDNGHPVTTSFTIAEGSRKSHKTVIQLVRQYIDDLEEFGRVAFKIEPFNTAGGTQTREVAILNEQQATLLLTYMRNNDVVRAFKKRLVKAFYELARQQRAPAEANLSRLEILQLAMESEQQRLKLEQENRQLEHRIEEDAPKVAFAEEVTTAPDAITVAKAAKILGTGQNRLFAFLRRNGWVTRYNEPYQSLIERGYLDVKLGSWTHPRRGLQASVTALITGKGLARLRALYDDPEALHAA